MKNLPRLFLRGLCMAALMPLLQASAADPATQSTNQTINLVFPVQGLAYAKVNVSPTPISVTPEPPEGKSSPSVRNPSAPVTYKLTFPPNTNVTISTNQFTGSNPNGRLGLSTVNAAGATLSGISITALAMDGSTWNVTVTNAPARDQNNPPANWVADPYVAPAPPPVKGDFRIEGPDNAAMITDTRRPRLKWKSVAYAVKYHVYLNISRTDYDWAAPGSLLDRYTEVGVVSDSSYLLQQDLPDRWTYKWYVVAELAKDRPHEDKSGDTIRSDIGTFSVYIPVLTKFDDGVPIVNGCRDLNKDGTIEPYEDWHNPPSVRVADLMSRMTLHEKVMQLFFNTQQNPEAGFGFGPFSLEDLPKYQMAAAKTRLGIPSVVIGDTIHGYKTIYPTEPGLAATRDLQIIWAVGDMQRRESLPVGERGSLSPLAEVGTKVLYPRIQEGCGEDADFAAAMLRAIVCGMQGGPEVNPHSMMITVKHWPSQGAGGEAGVVYDGTTIWYHMRPWHGAIEAGASAIMPGYSGSWLLNTEGHGAGDDPGIIGFLRNTMGYKGVICTDWLPSGAWVGACTAGSDVMGGANPGQMGDFEKQVPESRIDEAVRRVLDLKFRMGIFEDPYGEGVNGAAEWHTPQNVAIARKAASESLTLLKNDGPLPIRLPEGSAIVVDGPRADDPRCMATWRSDFHETDFGSKTFFRAIALRAAQAGVTVYAPKARKDWREAPSNVKWDAPPADGKIGAAIVVVGETYYTHGTFWDKDSPYLPDDPAGPPHDAKDGPQYAVIQQYHDQHIPVIVVCLLPRPYVLTNVNKLADALMVVYRPGDEGGTAVAGMLWGDTVPSGKLSWQLPLSMDQIGTDDTAHWQDQPDKWDLPYDMGATPEELKEIRAAIAAGKHIEPIYGKPLYQAGSGLQGFGLTDSTPPEPFKLLAPADGANITGALAAFKWQPTFDPETGIQRYEVYLDEKLISTIRNPGIGDESITLSRPDVMLTNGKHSWYVKAYNWANGVTTSATSTFTMNDTTPPAPFQAYLPANNATVAGTDPVTFFWEQSSDEGTGLANYELLLDGRTAASIKPSRRMSPTTNLALGKNASASSTEGGNTPASAVDGDPQTRWSSNWKGEDNPDAAWFTVDLGDIYSIKEITINWESPGKQYLIQVSDDNTHWTTIYTKTGEVARQEDLKGLSGAGRYVRMQGVQRSGGYGYSIWEFGVFGSGLEHATVPVPAGKHTWQVRAIDGAGNAAMNANGEQTITR